MCYERPYYLAPDCPMCGEKDSVGAWKGARMGSTSWGHNYSCCSDACGKAFLNSDKHKKLERQKIKMKLKMLQSELESLS